MYNFKLLLTKRVQSRSIQYNKRDFERLILPIINNTTHKVEFESNIYVIYILTFETKEEALLTRKTITQTMSQLHSKATYGWLPV